MNSTNMDVDMDSNGGNVALHEQEKIIKLHPLAIIGISDHHTRVSCGGSALPSSSPTIGLLWGQQSSPRPGSGACQVISIIDAEEVESGIDANANANANANADKKKYVKGSLTQEQMEHIETKIELHQKVFPMHEVVGWYRVLVQPSRDGVTGTCAGAGAVAEEQEYALPTEQDLEIHHGWMKKVHENPIFVIMDATEHKHKYQDANTNSNSNGSTGEGNGGQEKTDGEDAREKMDRDEELPLMVYESIGSATGAGAGAGAEKGHAAAFVNLEFELETFEPERIAVEKVFKTRPEILHGADNGIGGEEKVGVAKKQGSASTPLDSKKKGQSQVQVQPEAQPTLTELHVQSVMASVDAMNSRVAILLDFLRKTRDGEIEPHHGLLRQVMSLVKQLPLVMEGNPKEEGVGAGSTNQSESAVGMGKSLGVGQEYEKQYGDMLVMSYLAALAKTTKAVIGYSEKVHILNERPLRGAGGFGRVEGRQGRDLDNFETMGWSNTGAL